jgi:SAM-dependent methyltransferase
MRKAADRGGGAYWDPAFERWLVLHPQTLWRRHSDAVHTQLLERWLTPANGSALKTDLFDEAVSEGLYPTLAARATRVVGIDSSPVVVEAAVARHPGLVAVCCDVLQLPFEDGEFDVVVSNSTLDHLETRDELFAGLCELRRVLRRDGTLVLTLDNPWNPVIALSKALPRRWLNRAWARVGRSSARLGLVPYRIGATLSLGAARSALGHAGLRVEDVRAIVHAPRALAVLAAHVLERRASPPAQERFLSLLMTCERLEQAPSRFVTGHLLAFRARAA